MKQDQKKTLATSLMMAALMVGSTSAGLIENLTIWLWNFLVYMEAVGGSMGCYDVGVWGLFWDDDNGAMIQMCMDIFGGSYIEFPVEYDLN